MQWNLNTSHVNVNLNTGLRGSDLVKFKYISC